MIKLLIKSLIQLLLRLYRHFRIFILVRRLISHHRVHLRQRIKFLSILRLKVLKSNLLSFWITMKVLRDRTRVLEKRWPCIKERLYRLYKLKIVRISSSITNS